MDEKDFEEDVGVFLNGADMIMEEEYRSDREGVYLEESEQGTKASA